MSEPGGLEHHLVMERHHAPGVQAAGEVRLLPHRRSRYERLVKPALDRVLAACALLVLSPLILAVAVTVAVSLGRPLLYRQSRIGLGGEPFDMLKFRTMLPDRRRNPQGRRRAGVPERRRTHKSSNDPRHVPVGRFLRRYSLDELPQLWNVLRGDMSMVGPRPELAHVVDSYQPWQHARHAVKPGITGLWQVTDRASGELMLHHTDTDLRYLQQVSLRTDVRILLRTLPAAVSRQGG